MAKDIDLSTITKAYAKWAPVYDMIYSRILRPGRNEAVKAALACGKEILEVGVGTGLSLGDYPSGYRVTGIDLSKPMLDKAAEKLAGLPGHAVTGLAVMDACRLGFRDGAFDAVVGQYMITLVPDAEMALDEFARVVKPGGEIILVNHIGAEQGLVAQIEKAAAPLAKRVGWRSEFQLQRIRNWAQQAGFSVASAKRVGFAGFFTVVRLRDARMAKAEAA
ncbi:MAG: class I SAM-dependent methyltransferase [Beijerinckiaceae bacterium]|nr:class I SAM-dependent methyltransferase [Beijerinckiaceae bacterium]